MRCRAAALLLATAVAAPPASRAAPPISPTPGTIAPTSAPDAPAAPAGRGAWLWSGSAGVDSDARFRGVSLSDGKPTARLALDLDHTSGPYAGIAATRVEPAPGERSALLRLQLGYAVRLGDGWSLAAGAAKSRFIGDSRYDYLELQFGFARTDASVQVHVSPDYFGRGVRTLYLDGALQHRLADRWRLLGHAGLLVAGRRRDPQPDPQSDPSAAYPGTSIRAGDDARRSRADLRLGLAWAPGDVELQLAWVGATRGGPYPATDDGRRAAWIASLTASF